MRSIRFHRRVHHPVGAASLAALALLFLALGAIPAAAQLPDPSVTPVPETPREGSAFVLDVQSICCSTPGVVDDVVVTLVDGVIRVDAEGTCGPLSAVTSYEYSVAVPPLPPGEYPVEVYATGFCHGGETVLEISDTVTVEAAGALSGIRCKPAVEPAATLLFPYVEVDPSSPDGITTLLALTNTLAEPVLAKVVLWSDWALPVGSFHVYLSGYDVQTLNLRDVLAGRLPETGPARFDVATPVPVTLEGCDPQNVAGTGFDGAFVTDALLGEAVDGQCWSSQRHPGRAVGYVTVDVVDSCSDLVPGDEGYFGSGGLGVASDTNALLGDLILAETGESFAQGVPAVHLVADESAFEPGDPTFYSVYVDGDASDARMPLGRVHGARYVENEGFDGGTELLVWREAIRPPTGPSSCGGQPFGIVTWLDFTSTIDVFDEEENRVGVTEGPGLVPFASATQRVSASSLSPFDSGWIRLELRRQSAALSVMRALGRFSAGMPAAQLDDACQALGQTLE